MHVEGMRKVTERERSLVWKSLTLDDGRQLLLLNYPAVGEEQSPDEVNRNLLCVDDGGRVYWQVMPPPPFQPTGDPFVHVERKGRRIEAARFFGDVCEVDDATGAATVVGWTK